MRKYFFATVFSISAALSSTSSATARAADAVPDEALIRRQVDDVIKQSPNHRATLGTLQAAIELSISFGAPAWNAGDHDACCRFYVKTAESLCASFAAVDSATAPARVALDDLKAALDRVRNSTEVDGNAWTMRFVFDKTQVLAANEVGLSAQLLELGQQCTARSRFQDAELAYTAALAALKELDGQPVENIPPAARFAPLALSEAHFGQRHYAQAAAAAQEGLRYLPEWPTVPIDIRKHFADPALYGLLFDDLKDAATKHPDDPALQFLLGYHLFFTGRKPAAKEYFDRTIQLDPTNPGAKRMLQDYDGTYRPPPHRAMPGGSQA